MHRVIFCESTHLQYCLKMYVYCFVLYFIVFVLFHPSHKSLSYSLTCMLLLYAMFYGWHCIGVSFFGSVTYISMLCAAFSVYLPFFLTRQSIAWSQTIINHALGTKETAVACSHEYFTSQWIKCRPMDVDKSHYCDPSFCFISLAYELSRAHLLGAKLNC